MSFLRSRFVQAVVILVGAFVVLRFGIRPPAPWSVIQIYMAVVVLAVLIYVSSDTDSWRSFVDPIRATLVDPGRRPVRLVLAVLLPILLGYYAYTQAAAGPEAPAELRAVHPAPPSSIQFRSKEINISGVDNPLRKDAANVKKHVAAGGEIYVRNCMYCHGDNLDGHGRSPFSRWLRRRERSRVMPRPGRRSTRKSARCATGRRATARGRPPTSSIRGRAISPRGFTRSAPR